MHSDALTYWNGSWVSFNEVAIPLDDFGFSMGVTVVERLRTFRGEAFRLQQHVDRLADSLRVMGWDVATLTSEVSAALEGFIERNRALIVEDDDWYLVAFVTPGNSAAADQPTVCVHGGPLPFHNWAPQFETGVNAVIVDVRQVPENCWPPQLKCRSRIHYYLADCEAQARQPGARAILLDQDGFVGEGTTANVVAYYADRGLVTPSLSKVLPGISQDVLFELAAEREIRVSQADITPAELATADEILLTSTSVCMLPVVSLDGQPVGTGQPGAVYRQLLDDWSALVGVDIEEQAQRFSQR